MELTSEEEAAFKQRFAVEATNDFQSALWQDLKRRFVEGMLAEYVNSPMDLYVKDVIWMVAERIELELSSRQPGLIDLRAFLDAAGRQDATVLAERPKHAWPVVTMTLHGNSEYDLPLFRRNEGMRQCTRFWLQECNVQGLNFLYGYA
jgi:hypothetical protein